MLIAISGEQLGQAVIFPDVEHVAASSYLRELAASDCSTATIRSYAYFYAFIIPAVIGAVTIAVVPSPSRARTAVQTPA